MNKKNKTKKERGDVVAYLDKQRKMYINPKKLQAQKQKMYGNPNTNV